MNPDPNLLSVHKSDLVQTLTVNLDHNRTAETEENPPRAQAEGPSLVQDHSPTSVQNKNPIQIPADMCPLNGSASSPDSEGQNPQKDQDPDQNQTRTEDRNPVPVRDLTQSPDSVQNDVLCPVQVKDLEAQSQTIVLTKPSDPNQNPGQSIVVRVPALALLKALVQNSGQTHVRIPLQTQGVQGSVLVPSTTASNIHLTASVQSLLKHPGVVQNKAGIILSSGKGPASVQNPIQIKGLVQIAANSPSSASNLVQNPDPAQNVTATFQIKSPVLNPAAPNPVQTNSLATPEAVTPDEDLDPDPDLDLVPVPLPPEAVRALSPPLEVTPLKPSVPPMGFRLNGKLIPLLPGGEDLELFVHSHPSGSRSRLTSVQLNHTPAPPVFPQVSRAPGKPTRPVCTEPRPPVTTPRPVYTEPRPPAATPRPPAATPRPPAATPRPPTTTPRPPAATLRPVYIDPRSVYTETRPSNTESPQIVKKTPPPLQVNKPTISHQSPNPKPQPCVTSPQKPKTPAALLHKGDVTQKQPPDCLVCTSKFKMVSELRGFVCMCGSNIVSALHMLKLRRKDERTKAQLKKKLLNQHQRVSKPQSYHSYASSKSFSSLQKSLKSSEPRPSMSPGLSWPRPSVSPGLSWPRPSVSPGLSRPHPSVSPGVSWPRPSVSPGVSRPSPSPSPGVSTLRPSVSPAKQMPRPSVSPVLQPPRPSVSPGEQRPRPSVSPSVQRPRPSVSPVLQRPRPSPSPSAVSRPEVSSPSTEVTIGGATGRLVIHLEDFYYGSAEGENAVEQVRLVASYRCTHCAQVLPNNISLMQHTTEHIKESFRRYCPHCFRQFFTPAKLQHHVEAVHGPKSRHSRVVCQICELDFDTEIFLLMHMKEVHKPGEMPYSCQICGFRSSFFSQTWKHFEESHCDTRYFLCQYCLRVFKKDYSYQQHVARHLMKQVYSCRLCRLQFHVAKEQQDHQWQFHKTHVRPAQLSGLRPGTMVSVRTFQAVSTEAPVVKKPSAAPSKPVVKVQPMQPITLKRKAVESLGQIFDHLYSSDSSSCVECLSQVEDLASHYPTTVSCSRCHFRTCCSRAYANHMINNHSGKRMRPLYPQAFTSCPRSDGNLECITCGFSSHTGDVMAVHLTKNPKHTCLCVQSDEGEEELFDEQSETGHRGRFVSIENLSSAHMSITTVDKPAHLSSPAAMTITITGPAHSPPKPVAPLPASRLSVVLHSLLHGAASSARLFGVSQGLIGRWQREQKKTLNSRRWRWDTTASARWVLTERELHRQVTPEAILELSLRTLGPKTLNQTRLNWAVDFLLRHDLGVETRSKELRDVGYSAVTDIWDKVNSLRLLPSYFCCLDEFPVFLDPGALSSLAPEALRLWGRGEERPLVEVLLCGASDGTLLPPMLFYGKDLARLPQGFPTNVFIQARDGGFSLREKTRLWAHKVWLPHLGDSTSSVLLLDEHSGHMTADFVEPLRVSCTELVYVPPGCGFLVQPLDQAVAPVVRDFLKVRWSQLVSQSPDCSESDLIFTLGCWFSEVCVILNSNKDFIHRSFLCVGTRYKTAEITHHTLNHRLHHALIQPTPPLSAAGQSEALEEAEEAGLLPQVQSEALEEAEEAGLLPQVQSEALEEAEEAGLLPQVQSEALEEAEEAGLLPQVQSEALEEAEEAGLLPQVHSEALEEAEEAGLLLHDQSKALEEAGLMPHGQSEEMVETEEAGLDLNVQSEALEEAGLLPQGQSEAVEEAGLLPPIQSEEVEMEEAGLHPQGQSETLEEAGLLPPIQSEEVEMEEAGVQPQGQSEAEEAELDLNIQSEAQEETQEAEGHKGAGLQAETQSGEAEVTTKETDVQDMEVDQSEALEEKEAGLKPDSQSEAQEEAGLKPDSQSEAQEEAGLKPDSQSEPQEEAGLKPDSQSESREVLKVFEGESEESFAGFE